CSGTTSGTSASGNTPAATTRADTEPTGGAAPASGADVCEYLRGQIPTLEGIGSEVGAMSNLTVNLYSWYEKKGAVPDGAQIDEQVAKECPDVAAQVYKLAGIKSFATL
ncbi:MAG TPA: hypothetical protein VNO31_25665, partial [Umezawaea sp.]|nr:hypothetical protein [Umezawaea sp.]